MQFLCTKTWVYARNLNADLRQSVEGCYSAHCSVSGSLSPVNSGFVSLLYHTPCSFSVSLSLSSCGLAVSRANSREDGDESLEEKVVTLGICPWKKSCEGGDASLEETAEKL